MIPIKLSIEGLYSYQDKQTIDFTKLTSNHLFGIFGTVGSGKSSVLEAITFALYGKTDRLLLSGDNRNYNMMNLKSNVLFIEFDFEAGNEAQSYRVQVSAKRNSKKYEDVKKADRLVYKKNGSEYIPITQNELEDTIGLSYDNFKRTIIIPQGKFQEFLQLKNAERTQMMKELFNLHKYELSPKVKNLELANNANIQNLEGRLEQLGEVSIEQQEAHSTLLNQIKKDIAQLETSQKILEKNIQVFKELKDQTEQLSACKTKRIELNRQKESIENLEKQLAEYEYCIIYFKSTLEAISRNEQQCNALQNTIKLDGKEQEVLQNKIELLNDTYKNISLEYAKLDALKKEAEDVRKIIDIKNLSNSIEEEKERIKKGETLVNQVSEKIKLTEQCENKAGELLITQKSAQPDIETINQAQQWHLQNNAFTSSFNELTKEKANTKDQIKKLQDDLGLFLNKLAVSFISKEEKNWIEELLNTENKLEVELKKINTKLEQQLIKSGLENYSKTLIPGEDCPLCGSQHHPHPINTKDMALQIDHLKNKVAEKEKEINNSRKIRQQVETYMATLKPLEAQILVLNTKIEKLKLDQEKHKSDFTSSLKNKDELKKATQRYKETKVNIENLEQELIKFKKELSTETKNKEKYKDALRAIQRQLDKNINSKELLEKSIPSSLTEKHKSQSNEQIKNVAQNLDTRIKEITENYESTRNLLDETTKKLAVVEGKLDTNKKHLEAETKHLNTEKHKLEEAIEKSSFTNIEYILSTLNLNLDIESSKQKIKNYHNNLQVIKTEIEKLSQSIGDQKYDEQKHKDTILKAKENSEKLSNANREHGKVETLLKELSQKLVLQKDLNLQLKKLILRADEINTLRKLFYKSGFVNYISSVYLQNLCATANERFYKMTRQSLSLELSEDNNFEVRDYMNGGKLRSVKTLSGGQTFQAALSLALALADNIQSLTKTERNFFFLDEGFGSLDKESLEIVFSTLKNLRNENRIVGVISHVEEMQQEISTYLNIRKDEDTGSYIEESWNR